MTESCVRSSACSASSSRGGLMFSCAAIVISSRVLRSCSLTRFSARLRTAPEDACCTARRLSSSSASPLRPACCTNIASGFSPGATRVPAPIDCANTPGAATQLSASKALIPIRMVTSVASDPVEENKHPLCHPRRRRGVCNAAAAARGNLHATAAATARRAADFAHGTGVAHAVTSTQGATTMCTIWEMAETIRAEQAQEERARREAEPTDTTPPAAAETHEAPTRSDSGARSGLIAALALVFGLNACSHAPDLAKVDADVQKAQAAGEKKVASAQASFDKANADARRDVTVAQVDARVAATDDPHAVPISAVNAPPSRQVARARSDAALALADAQYDLDHSRAEADYDVALARCEAKVGDLASTCK